METKTVKLYSLDYSNVKTYLIAAHCSLQAIWHYPNFSTLYRKAA